MGTSTNGLPAVKRAGTPGLGALIALFAARAVGAVREKLWLVGGCVAALWSVAKLSPVLISARNHSLLLSHSRMLLVSERLGVTATFLGTATVAWIPVDIVLFQADWSLVVPLIAARLCAGGLFFALAGAKSRSDVSREVIESLALIIAIGVVFFLFAHRIVANGDEGHLSSAGHAQYILMPIALIAGIAIFPLTLKEVSLLSVVPLTAVVIEMLHGDGETMFAQASAAALLTCAVGTAAAASSLCQLNLFASLHRESTTDHLTGALSRRAGVELLSLMFASCQKESKPLSLAFFDLDYFKVVNDYYGHEVGDRVLKQVAARLKDVGSLDSALIRWGGEEFILVLPGTDADGAIDVAVAMGRTLGPRPDDSTQTVSIGLAECGADQIKSWKQLVEIADKRMYLAKKAGRDRLLGPASIERQLAGGT